MGLAGLVYSGVASSDMLGMQWARVGLEHRPAGVWKYVAKKDNLVRETSAMRRKRLRSDWRCSRDIPIRMGGRVS